MSKRSGNADATGDLRAGSVALVACRVLEAEIGAVAADARHIVRREWFDIGLHDRPERLRGNLTAAIARAEADSSVEQVVLAYGLCGLALVGLAPRRCTLVVPRAHDCLTLFLGDRERYAETMRREPGTYWYSPGWNREKRVPGPDREATLRKEYTARFGAEQAESLLEAERGTFAHHTCAGYTDLGLPGDDAHRRYAEACARSMGWRFEHHRGDPALLRALLHGPWDAGRFLVVTPGEQIEHSVDAAIVRAAKVPNPPPATSRRPAP